MEEDNKLVEERREKLKALRAQGNAYPNDFRKHDLASVLHASYGAMSKEELEKARPRAVVAGRMMLKRVMGKASFATLQGRERPHPGLRNQRPSGVTKISSTGTSATSSAWRGMSSRP